MSTCPWCQFCDVEIRDNPFLCPTCAARCWPPPPVPPKPSKLPKKRTKKGSLAKRKINKAARAAELHERLVAKAAEVFPKSKIVRERKRRVSFDRR